MKAIKGFVFNEAVMCKTNHKKNQITTSVLIFTGHFAAKVLAANHLTAEFRDECMQV